MDFESPLEGVLEHGAEAGRPLQLQVKTRCEKQLQSLTRGAERPVGVVVVRCQGSYRDAQGRYQAVRSDRGASAAVSGERGALLYLSW